MAKIEHLFTFKSFFIRYHNGTLIFQVIFTLSVLKFSAGQKDLDNTNEVSEFIQKLKHITRFDCMKRQKLILTTNVGRCVNLTPNLHYLVRNYFENVSQVTYSFKYFVEEPKFGIFTHHDEEREGDLVRGSYSLLQPDGKLRIVSYQVDTVSGFKPFVLYRQFKGKLRHV